MRIIAVFEKGETQKFCSHLDLQKTLIRAFSRGDIPVKFTQGYHKHPVFSMALALPVGVTSKAEYLDVALAGEITPEAFSENMNAALPQGLRILRAKLVEDKASSLTPLVYAAGYTIKLKGKKAFQPSILEIMAKNAIIIEKKTKTKTVPTDIRGMILDFVQHGDCLLCTLRCGQVNLKPRDLLGLVGLNQEDCLVERTAVYAWDGVKLHELFNFI